MIDLRVRNTGKEVVLKDHTTEYEIYLKVMHGDADLYQENRFYFSDKRDFYNVAVLLSHTLSVKCPHRTDSEYVDYFVKVAKYYNIPYEYLENKDDDEWVSCVQEDLYNFIGMDSTNNDCYAAVDKLEFYYHVSPLKKEVVEIQIGDNYYSNFCYFDKMSFYDGVDL